MKIKIRDYIMQRFNKHKKEIKIFNNEEENVYQIILPSNYIFYFYSGDGNNTKYITDKGYILKQYNNAREIAIAIHIANQNNCAVKDSNIIYFFAKENEIADALEKISLTRIQIETTLAVNKEFKEFVDGKIK